MTSSDSAAAIAPSSYPDDEVLFRELAAAEKRHFWFKARNQVIAAILRRVTATLPAGFRALEIGCGTGNVLRLLEEFAGVGRVVGMDMFQGALRYARERTRCGLVQADMHSPPFLASFHLVGMFDVVEHFADDHRVLLDARALLQPGGVLLLTVPAHMGLWSYADEFAGHQRRYDIRELEAKLRAANFEIQYLSYFMAATFPVMWLKRRTTSWAHRRPTAAEARELFLAELRPVPVVNKVLGWLGAREATRVASGRRLPFGTSLVAVAARPGS
jgi:SAM-dependent methyltransferase